MLYADGPVCEWTTAAPLRQAHVCVSYEGRSGEGARGQGEEGKERKVITEREPPVAPGACVQPDHPPVKSCQFHLSWNTAPGRLGRSLRSRCSAGGGMLASDEDVRGEDDAPVAGLAGW